MDKNEYSHLLSESPSWEQVFSLVSSTGSCVWKILFEKKQWRMGAVYEISKLGTANGWDELEKLWLDGIDVQKEKVSWLLYIMFKSFIDTIEESNDESFSINIDKTLFHLEGIYRKLYRHLLENSYIDSGMVTKGAAVFRCER